MATRSKLLYGRHDSELGSSQSGAAAASVARSARTSPRPAPRLERFALLAVITFLGLLGVVLMWAGDARAAQITVGFDDTASGTTLTSQYASADGVTFGGNGPVGDLLGTTWIVVASPEAHSLPNEADLSKCGFGDLDFCFTDGYMGFANPQSSVSFFIGLGLSTSTGTGTPTVTAYDASGTVVATAAPAIAPGVHTPVTLNSNTADISYVRIEDGVTGITDPIAIDDLTIASPSGAPAPDFALVPTFASTGIAVRAGGGPVTAAFTLRRLNGSTGPISFATGTAPTGISVALAPSTPDSQGDGSTVAATITAAAGTQAGQRDISVTATPDAPSAGSQSHKVTIPITVQAPYTMQVQGLEITQGVQTFTLPTRNPNNPSAPVAYSGAMLAWSMPTAVRVFADAPGAPPSGVAGVSAQLTVYDKNGRPFGSPLYPTSGPAGLFAGPGAVLPSERENPTGSYDFALPAGWIVNARSMTATLTPPASFLSGPPTAVPCTDQSCVPLRSLTVDGINSVDTGTTAIDTVELAINGQAPNPFYAFRWAKRLLPANVFPDVDAGTIDITDESQGCPRANIGQTCAGRSDEQSVIDAALEDFASNYDNGQGPAMVGVTNQDYGVENGQTFEWGSEPTAVVDTNRPVNDVAHEIGHMFGLPHAGAECGGGGDGDSDDTGQNGESWPPDQEGYIDGVGLDLATSAPYPVIAGPPPTYAERSLGNGSGHCSPNQSPSECGLPNPLQFFDFMSYCTASDPNDDGKLGSTNAWISVRNWDYIVKFSACALAGGAGLPSLIPIGEQCTLLAENVKNADASAAATQEQTAGFSGLQAQSRTTTNPITLAAAAAAGPKLTTEASGPGMLRAYGFTLAGRTLLPFVDSTPTRRPLSGELSPMRLVLMGRGGATLSSAPLLETVLHIDGVPPGALLQGAVRERPGATALAIVEHGKVLAEDLRPAHTPQVRLISPLGGERLQPSRPVVVRWKVTDPDHVHLTVWIDFSSNNGRSWSSVYMGGNSGRTSVPLSALIGSHQERVRLRVSDGFDEVVVASRPFFLKLIHH